MRETRDEYTTLNGLWNARENTAVREQYIDIVNITIMFVGVKNTKFDVEFIK